jgi:hypothetical protein
MTPPQPPSTNSTPRFCACGAFLGDLVTIEMDGTTVTILKAGSINIYNIGNAECGKCGAPIYHSVNLHKLLRLIRLTGREVNEEELTKTG